MKRVLLLTMLLVSTFIYGCCGCPAKEKKAMSVYDEEFAPQTAAIAPVGSLRWDFYYNN